MQLPDVYVKRAGYGRSSSHQESSCGTMGPTLLKRQDIQPFYVCKEAHQTIIIFHHLPRTFINWGFAYYAPSFCRNAFHWSNVGFFHARLQQKFNPELFFSGSLSSSATMIAWP